MDSSVCIATGYGLDGPGIESWWGWDFPHLSRPVLGPTQPPVQWIPALSWGVKSGRGVMLTPHALLVPWSRKSRAIPLLPLWAVRPVQSFSDCTTVRLTFFHSACRWCEEVEGTKRRAFSLQTGKQLSFFNCLKHTATKSSSLNLRLKTKNKLNISPLPPTICEVLE